jgi:hypothetical protein
MSGRDFERIHHGISVDYKIGVIGCQPDVTQGRKTQEYRQKHSHDQSAYGRASERGVNLRAERLARVDFLFQLESLPASESGRAAKRSSESMV